MTENLSVAAGRSTFGVLDDLNRFTHFQVALGATHRADLIALTREYVQRHNLRASLPLIAAVCSFALGVREAA